MTFLNFSQLPESVFRREFSGKHFLENKINFHVCMTEQQLSSDEFFSLSLSFLSPRIKFHFSPCKKSNELIFFCWFVFVLILVLIFLLLFILLLIFFKVYLKWRSEGELK